MGIMLQLCIIQQVRDLSGGFFDDAVRRPARAKDLSTSLVWKSYLCFYERDDQDAR